MSFVLSSIKFENFKKISAFFSIGNFFHFEEYSFKLSIAVSDIFSSAKYFFPKTEELWGDFISISLSDLISLPLINE